MRAVIAILLGAVLGGCASHPSAPLSDERLAQELVGVWCNSNDGGKTCWAFDEFSTSGQFLACGRNEDELVGFAGGGNFTVAGQRMCYVVRTATANFWLQPGSRYCTDILSIGASSHRYRDIDTGKSYELLRVPPSTKQCPPTR
jgi:hypothetical protein